MKIGDLVIYKSWASTYEGTGIIVGFDEEKDPIVRDNKSGVVCASWRSKVEVVSESR